MSTALILGVPVSGVQVALPTPVESRALRTQGSQLTLLRPLVTSAEGCMPSDPPGKGQQG